MYRDNEMMKCKQTSVHITIKETNIHFYLDM